MKYEPKLMHNPSNKEKEFMCGGTTYLFAPGEKRILDGVVADHALKEDGLGLLEVGVDTDTQIDGVEVSKLPKVDYNKMPWKKLIGIAGDAKVYKIGMDRPSVERALEEYDGQRGTL